MEGREANLPLKNSPPSPQYFAVSNPARRERQTSFSHYTTWIRNIESISTHSVNDAGIMEVLDATEQLVEEVGHSVVVQLNSNHPTEIGIHQLHHNVTEEKGKNGHIRN